MRTLKSGAGGRRGIRWWLIRRTPELLLDYPLESLLVAVGWLAVAGYAVGADSPVLALSPPWLVAAWLTVLVVGAGTGTWALATGAWGTWLASSMTTMAVAYAVYAVAVAGAVGDWQGFLLALLCAALAFWRGMLLAATFELVYDTARRGGP
jgi:hypothetical protein